MENFPSNSNHAPRPKNERIAKPEPKKVVPVVTGEARKRKKPMSRRFAETFFGGASPRDVWAYVLLDVLIPAGRDMVAEAGREAIERTIYGDSHASARRRSRSRNDDSPFGKVRYDKMSRDRRDRDSDRYVSRRGRAKHDFDEIVLDNRHEAQDVLEQLRELVDRYDEATVADFYTLANAPWEYTDQKYGWTDLRDAGIVRVRDGYLVDLPRPEILD